MAKVIIEVDGVRHKQVFDEPHEDANYYCEMGRCSLFGLCQKSGTDPCRINDNTNTCGGVFLHYEKEE